MFTTVLVAPAGRRPGLTTACLGLVRAFDRQGLHVGFVKPIADRGRNHSAGLVALGAQISPTPSVPRSLVEELLAAGDDQTLMEHVVEVAARAAEGTDVLIAEGMSPESGSVYSSRVNALMLRALDAELLFVASPTDQTPEEVAGSVAITARGFGALTEGHPVGCLLNRVCSGAPEHPAADVEMVGPLSGRCAGCSGAAALNGLEPGLRSALEAEGIRPIGVVPCHAELAAPRVHDVAEALGAKVLLGGDPRSRRVRGVSVCAMSVVNALRAMKPGALIITPGDRHDILLAAAMSMQDGIPLAGVLLTGGLGPDPRVTGLCRKAFDSGLSLLTINETTFQAALHVASLNTEIQAGDADRVERTMNFVADRIDQAWVTSFAKPARAPRLSPPAFRHRLVEAARADRQRIVLPEGNEPRTVAAAAIIEARGIARCVLLGRPDEVREVAAKQGVTLPPSVEVVDPAEIAPRYVAPLVERRRAKGMTPERAEIELQDPIMVGTMMLALDEADGLVSGAVHSTAHTIRPALQIIKTVPGCNLVSSVFFMCLPDQVLVFGDCAVNPNPTAEQLADIAIQSADSALAFGIPARVAMLSYSTGASGTGEDVEKVKEATRIAQGRRPDLALDGPLQYDAAIMPEVARLKAPDSPVAGQATVFVFPDLNAGNMTYKAVQRAANVLSIGPMLQGLAKPVNDLSRGCLVEDIVFTVNLSAIQAQQARRARAGSATTGGGA